MGSGPSKNSMITDKHPLLDDNYDWNQHNAQVRALKRMGYIELPNWFPGGWPDYEYEIVGGIDAMMFPKPRLKDRIRFQLPSILLPKFVKRWLLRRRMRKINDGELPF